MVKRKPLAESFPDLAKEAHGWDPTQIHDLTNVKMEWISKKGHTWFAFTYTRTGKNPSGCPVCANKSVAIGSNDLKSQIPELALEADIKGPRQRTRLGSVSSSLHNYAGTETDNEPNCLGFPE